MSPNTVRTLFPIYRTHPELVYLDTGATALTPQPVIDAVQSYYITYGANIHRGLYHLSDETSQAYERARKIVAEYIGAQEQEIVFTSGATAGLNMLAKSIGKTLGADDVVVLTAYEHHANLLPWQQAAKEYGFELRFLPYQKEHDPETLATCIDERTKVVSFVHVSNTLGTVLPAEALITRAQEVGACTIVDASQSIVHMPLDVTMLGCDFLVFSGHKLYGPTGIGVLYGKQKALEELDPAYYGGGMIQQVDLLDASWAPAPQRFEAGTPHIAGALGLAAAIEVMQDVGISKVQAHEEALTKQFLAGLSALPAVQVIHSGQEHPGTPVISFVIDGAHPHDVAEVLARHNVAVRAGHHCTEPLIKTLGLPGTSRVSFGMYNTETDVTRAIQALADVCQIFEVE